MKILNKPFSLIICWLILSTAAIHAQVKISDLGNSLPGANSVLELESNNKGLLIPRMAINDVNSATPLSSPPEGMLVYSLGGSVPNGFYFWNGTKWKLFVQSVVPISDGGTGSSTQNFVDLTTTQTVAGAKTWSNLATFSTGITSTGGTVSLNASSNNNTDINTGTSTGIVTIGGSGNQTLGIGNNAAGQKSIGIGNAVANSSVSILSGGTGTIDLKSALTAAIDINAGTGAATPVNIGTGTTTGTVTLGGSGIQSINVGTGTGAKTIGIGDGISGNTVSIANGANTSTQTLNIANGASAANNVVNILSGTGTAGAASLLMANNTRVTTINLGNISPAAARTTTIAGGGSGVIDAINIGTGAATVAKGKTINIGTTAPTGTGTNSITIGAAGTNDGMGVRFGNGRFTVNKPLAYISTADVSVSPTVTQILDAGIFVCSPTNNGRIFTFPTAQGAGGLVQSLPGTPAIGDVFTVLISNNGSRTITLAAGTGGTLRGNGTVIASENRVIYVRVTSVTAGSETIDIF